MPEETDTRCIFCWSAGSVTGEHVFSKPIKKRLLAVPDDVELTWKDGSAELWAGETGAPTIDRLVIRAVCQPCNNEWMQRLDKQVAGDLTRWSERRSVRLGKDAFDALTRYLTKLLWVIRVGENWTTGAWIRGELPEPEFIPLSLIQDGKAIRELKSIDTALGLRVFIGAALFSGQPSDLIDIPPIPADGIRETQKVRRVNAGMILTFRAIGLRLWIVMSGLDERWRIRWPRGVTALSSQSRYNRLSTVSNDELTAPSLIFSGSGPVPDVETMFNTAFDLARSYLEAKE